MLPIQHTCQPCQDILQGSFNPEIFTASLSQVVDHCREKPAVTHALYTATEQFLCDAVTVVPVQATEISRVLARRLFDRIDQQAARETANAYIVIYSKRAAALPDRARLEDFRAAIVSHCPFRPAFIEFLTQKLATIETFQGTREVLRVLALAVRSLWGQQQHVPMIHTFHLVEQNGTTASK